MVLHGPRVVLYSWIKRYPALFMPLARWRETHKKRLPRPSTDIVIEGFTRCGNHPAVFAFLVAQKQAVDLAQHFHAPAPLMYAARHGIPAVLLIRKPVECISSAMIYINQPDPTPFLKSYIHFHEPLIPYIDRLVVSDFPQTVGDFGSVIAEVNRKFGRTFDLYHDTPEQRAEVERQIREEHESHMKSVSVRIPLPTKEKEAGKKLSAAVVREPRYAKLLGEAERLYELFARHAVGAGR